MGEAIIVAWFDRCSSLQVDVDKASRVLYSGLQRMLDLGAINGLCGVPCGRGDILRLGLRRDAKRYLLACCAGYTLISEATYRRKHQVLCYSTTAPQTIAEPHKYQINACLGESRHSYLVLNEAL